MHVRGALNRLVALGNSDLSDAQARTLVYAFVAHMAQALEAYDDVAIDVADDCLWVAGQKLAGGDAVSGAMVARLARSGLRGIFIQRDATQAELIRLARVLTAPWGHPETAVPDAALEAQFDNLYLDIEGVSSAFWDASAVGGSSDQSIEPMLRGLGDVFDLRGQALLTRVDAMLSALRSIPAGPSPNRGQHSALRDSRAGQAFRARLDGFNEGADVDAATLGVMLFELIRTLPDAQRVTQMAQFAVNLARGRVEDGRPSEGMDLLRRSLLLLDADLFPELPHRPALREALQALLGVPFREAIIAGWAIHPVASDWVGPVFTLAQVTSASHIASLLALGCAVSGRELRQAVADALLVVAEREGLDPRALLKDATEEQSCVILLALGRVADSTLVEPLLARAASPDPHVREAVLVALRRHQSPRIKAVVRSAVGDVAKGVRMEALRYLAVYRDAQAEPVIRERLLGAAVADPDEQGALATVYMLLDRATGVRRARDLIDTGRLDKAVMRALLRGLHGAGEEGHRAMDELGRHHPEMRPDLRQAMGVKS